ncbi:MAG: universal stress protein [Boseongicola sp.]|nr:universal stress protein [Boseongicola sp.]MDD9979275.1 universal stress protein [Boseongicola sp.]
MFSRIMIPVDLKHTHQLGKALSVSAEMARNYGSELHLVGVTMSAPTEIAPTPEAFAEKLGEFAARCATELGVAFHHHAEISNDMRIDLDEVLENAAEKFGADLIVMASHVPGLAEHVFASNAGYLASHASMSVMVVR